MKSKRSGHRYALIFYRRTLGRLALSALILGIVLLAVWEWSLIEPRDILFLKGEVLILAAAMMSLLVSLAAFLAQWTAYVKPFRDSLFIATPLLRMHISYRRIRSLHPALIQQIFPPDKQKWSRRMFLEPFMGKTALILELRGYPLNKTLLRMLLPGYMFYPQGDGFVLLVSDWMKFSTEFDSFSGAWLQKRGAVFKR